MLLSDISSEICNVSQKEHGFWSMTHPLNIKRFFYFSLSVEMIRVVEIRKTWHIKLSSVIMII